MMRIRSDIFLWLLILLGIILRMTDVGLPDMLTDEVQLALGKSAAWTPLAMQMIVAVQSIFGFETIVARGVSVAMGIATIPLFYVLARNFFEKRSALLATAIAALFPSHILFSRLAYPSIYLCFAWLLTLLCYIKANESVNRRGPAEAAAKVETGAFMWLIGLFIASVAASFMKSQGLVFPVLLLFGLLIEKRKAIVRDEVAWILLLSLIPVGLFFLTHPGVLATVLLYGGNMYGLSGFVQRISELVFTWWHLLTLFAIFSLISLRWFRALPWPVWTLLATIILTGFLLGPAHEYYSTHLILLALPIAVLLMRLTPTLRTLSIISLTITTFLFLGPHTLAPFAHHLYTNDPYWNTHTNKINEILKNTEEVYVLGYPGHHLRWYLEPRLHVGRFMNLEGVNGTFIILKKDKLPDPPKMKVLYEDARIVIAERS
ncbi:glycosyltransferase family 39 protein [Patescibacteria group bacterium]|nr:glycosyltransferase family 39 protein [Patescibacteria group bacterium]